MQENYNVRVGGVDLWTSRCFRGGDEYTAKDEPTCRLFSF